MRYSFPTRPRSRIKTRLVRNVNPRRHWRPFKPSDIAGIPVQVPKRGEIVEFKARDERPVHLLVEFYQDSSAERQAELSTCLAKNMENPALKHIHVFGKAEHLALLPDSAKLIKNPSPLRMTYASFFAYAAEHLQDEVCAIANADIYFDHTAELLGRIDLNGRFLCLTRWDVTPRGSSTFMNRSDSADVWIFDAPMKLLQQPEFFLGLPGCDNKIAFVAAEAGYRLENPSKTVVTHHLHISNKRNYTRSAAVPGPYVPHVEPTEMKLV